jgi:hypothetical protein
VVALDVLGQRSVATVAERIADSDGVAGSSTSPAELLSST